MSNYTAPVPNKVIPPQPNQLSAPVPAQPTVFVKATSLSSIIKDWDRVQHLDITAYRDSPNHANYVKQLLSRYHPKCGFMHTTWDDSLMILPMSEYPKISATKKAVAYLKNAISDGADKSEIMDALRSL